jgi:SNF2 family DNA or RNA helicase
MESVESQDQFMQLVGDQRNIRNVLDGNGNRFFINYELARVNVNELNRFLGLNRVHLVMDESHRIKAGMSTLQGRLALSLAVRATRRDVLSGTPMPQGPLDIASQADFLRPGSGLGQRIRTGESPSQVLNGLFVRTKKSELGLKDPIRHELRVEMNPAQAALYSTIANDTIAQFHGKGLTPSQQLYLSRGPAIRLLQSSVFPRLLSSGSHLFPELLDAAFDEGPGPKMLKAVEICEQNALLGRKTIVWSIFRDTIVELSNLMSHLGAEIVSGDNPRLDGGTINSRETALRNFRNSSNSFVLIANPAAASEGLSLHRECHDAVYVDRTYNAAHFLQSIDRIHRLGLDPDVDTNITVLKSIVPSGIVPSNVGSIDDSVWRRLRIKVDNLQRLLNDRDLQMIALSEDDVDQEVQSEMDKDDIIDLIRELTGSSSV